MKKVESSKITRNLKHWNLIECNLLVGIFLEFKHQIWKNELNKPDQKADVRTVWAENLQVEEGRLCSNNKQKAVLEKHLYRIHLETYDIIIWSTKFNTIRSNEHLKQHDVYSKHYK